MELQFSQRSFILRNSTISATSTATKPNQIEDKLRLVQERFYKIKTQQQSRKEHLSKKLEELKKLMAQDQREETAILEERVNNIESLQDQIKSQRERLLNKRAENVQAIEENIRLKFSELSKKLSAERHESVEVFDKITTDNEPNIAETEEKIKAIGGDRVLADDSLHKIITDKVEYLSELIHKEKVDREEQEKLNDDNIKVFFQEVVDRLDKEAEAQEVGENTLLEVIDATCQNLSSLTGA